MMSWQPVPSKPIRDSGPTIGDRAPIHIFVRNRQAHPETCRGIKSFVSRPSIVTIAPFGDESGMARKKDFHICYRDSRYAPGKPGKYHAFPPDTLNDHAVSWTEALRCKNYVIFRNQGIRLQDLQECFPHPISLIEKSEHFLVVGFLSRAIPRASYFASVPGYVASIPSHWDLFEHISQVPERETPDA